MSVPLYKPSKLRRVVVNLVDDLGNMEAVSSWRGYVGVDPLDYISVTSIPAGSDYTSEMTSILADQAAALLVLGYTDT